MRTRALLLGIAGWILLGADPVAAGTLTSATWTQTISGFSPFPFTRTIGPLGSLGATGTSTATSISVNLSPQFTTSFFVATPKLTFHVFVTQGGPQAITATPAMGNGTPGIPGTVVIMSAKHDSTGVNQSMFMVGNMTLLTVPLSNGKAGQITKTFTIVGAQGYMTLDFYAWTPGTLTFTGLTENGKALPNVTVQGSFNLTANGGGTVTLVSPSKLTAESAFGTTQSIWSVSTLKLSFVPEPSALLLLAVSAFLALRWRAAWGPSDSRRAGCSPR